MEDHEKGKWHYKEDTFPAKITFFQEQNYQFEAQKTGLLCFNNVRAISEKNDSLMSLEKIAHQTLFVDFLIPKYGNRSC